MKLLMVGAGGFACSYLRPLLDGAYPEAELEGIVDPYIASSPLKERITEAGIPVYDTMEAFYHERSADLAIISTPTFLHCEQSITALSNGSYVLCEKPAAPTREQLQRMMEAEKQTGRWIAVGFQWSFSDAIQRLKQDVLNGVLGKPVSLRTMIQWPRSRSYYRRGGGWGGRIEMNGVPVYDSIAANACAHYLHNMLFVLGDAPDESAVPLRVEAECLRANDIENFDTCVIRMPFANGAAASFVASHATAETHNPAFVYEFANAVVRYHQDESNQITATFRDGSVKSYGDPFGGERVKKLTDCILCIENGQKPICTVSTALPHASLIDQLQQQIVIAGFPSTQEADDRIYVEGLSDLLQQAYEKHCLLSEAGCDFAKTTQFEWKQ